MWVWIGELIKKLKIRLQFKLRNFVFLFLSNYALRNVMKANIILMVSVYKSHSTLTFFSFLFFILWTDWISYRNMYRAYCTHKSLSGTAFNRENIKNTRTVCFCLFFRDSVVYFIHIQCQTKSNLVIEMVLARNFVGFNGCAATVIRYIIKIYSILTMSVYVI